MYNACKSVFPESVLIGCYYHYKAALVRYLKNLKLFKGGNKKNLKVLVSILGMLPINYNGDIEYCYKILLNLENDSRFSKLKIFFDYFRKEWIPNFENNMLYYKLIPKPCRANTSLENYNKYLKENLDYKKCVEWINLLNFLKNEEVRITNNLINDEKNFIGTINGNSKPNINDINLKEIEENISLLNINEVKWIKWIFNSCRYDSFITLYITTFEKYLRDNLADCNMFINSLNKVALDLIHDPGSYSRFDFWKECHNYGLDVPNKFTSLYLKEGYISGLFSIYNNNDKFYIKTDIINQCFKCWFYKEKKMYILNAL